MPDCSGPSKLVEADVLFKGFFSMTAAAAIDLFALTRLAQQRMGPIGCYRLADPPPDERL
jgi:hypothetical protein